MSLAALARATSAPRHQPRLTDNAPLPANAPNPRARAAAPAPRTDGFDSLVKYIPTETVTIFVAICSARSAIETAVGKFSYGMAYAACAALTPLLLWLIAAGRFRAAGGTGPVPFHW